MVNLPKRGAGEGHMNDLIGRLVANGGVDKTAAEDTSASSHDSDASRTPPASRSFCARWNSRAKKRRLEQHEPSPSFTCRTPMRRRRCRVSVLRPPNMSAPEMKFYSRMRRG